MAGTRRHRMGGLGPTDTPAPDRGHLTPGAASPVGSGATLGEEGRELSSGTFPTAPLAARRALDPGEQGSALGLQAPVLCANMSVASAEELRLAMAATEQVCRDLAVGRRAAAKVVHAVLELGQNALSHAGEGSITLSLSTQPLPFLEVFVHDWGPGLPAELIDPPPLPRGTRPRGGLESVRYLADEFEIQAGVPGTHVRFVIYL